MTQVALKLESAKQPKQVLKMEVSSVFHFRCRFRENHILDFVFLLSLLTFAVFVVNEDGRRWV